MAREQGVAESAREYGFADLKGDLDQIGALAGGFDWKAEALPWQNPARGGLFSCLVTPKPYSFLFTTGSAGQLTRRVAEQLKFRQDIFLAEWPLDGFYSCCRAAQSARKYQPISRFPAVERDFSLILSEGASFASVRETIAALGIPEIFSIEAVDLFRGKNIPPGKFSLLVRITFQSQEATLTEAQLTDFSSRIISALERKLGATLRSV
jgi:phenylalanyl-tRNA synthetase beta subunit